MKLLLIIALILSAPGVFAANCVTNAQGKTVCSDGQSAVAVNPKQATVTTAQKSPGGVTTVQNSNGTKAAYYPVESHPASGLGSDGIDRHLRQSVGGLRSAKY